MERKNRLTSEEIVVRQGNNLKVIILPVSEVIKLIDQITSNALKGKIRTKVRIHGALYDEVYLISCAPEVPRGNGLLENKPPFKFIR